VINLVMGIGASVLAWLAINHALRPRIRVSDVISEMPRRSGPTRAHSGSSCSIRGEGDS